MLTDQYATSIVQSIYYGITIRAGEPRPQPPSPRYARHRRRIFILVVTSYLLYTLYETYHQVQLAGDFYRALGVSPLADDKTIKSRFRRLAAQHHPDKLGPGDGVGDTYFVYLKLAQDTLLDPAKRFAYDRFGPDMLNWGDRKSMQEFLAAALHRTIPQYVAGFLTIVFLNFTWWSDWGRYVSIPHPSSQSLIQSVNHLLTSKQWRFFTFAALLTLELTIVTHPQTHLILPINNLLPPPLRNILPLSTDQPFYLLPFQILTLARRASLTLHIFISQIAPPRSPQQPSPSTPGGNGGGADRLNPQTLQRLGQIAHLSRATDAEATRLLQLGFAPFRGDREGVGVLRKGMKEGLVLSSVRGSREVQEAVEQVIERKREEKKGE